MSSKKAVVSYVIMLSVFTIALMHSAELPNHQILSNMPQQSVTQSVTDNGVSTAVATTIAEIAIVLWFAYVMKPKTSDDSVETYCPWKNAHFATTKREVIDLENI